MSLKRPLPRPPAWIWALSTTGPPSRSKAAWASAGVEATTPRGTAAPAAASNSFAWYSWIFIVAPQHGQTPLSLYAPAPPNDTTGLGAGRDRRGPRPPAPH